MSVAKGLNLVAGVLLLLTACGGDVNISGGGAQWPWPWPATAPFFAEKIVSSDVAVGTQVRVRLEGFNGEIIVTGQPGKTSVTVTATLKVGSDSLLDAQAGLALMDVLVTDQPDKVLIQTQQPVDPLGRQYLAYYTVTIPDNLLVDVQQVNGYINVEAIDNTVVVHQQNGNVQLLNVFGDATVQDTNGSINVTMALPPGGQVTLSTVNGNIDLIIPTATSAQLSAHVGIGSITWDSNLPLVNVVQTLVSLSGTLGTGNGLIDLQTVNGSIHLAGF